MVETASTREAAGRALAELGEEYPGLVVLGGDLNKSTRASLFGARYPDRFFDFGPAEQNIVGVAAGLAASGKIPVVSTFAVFATSRPYDQLRVGVSQPRLNVKVIGSHAGIITGEDGVSAQAIEDVAIMCALPGFTVIVPADAVETAQAVRAAVDSDGPFYIRVSRSPTPVIHRDGYEFVPGRAETVCEGRHATIIACGIMVSAAMDAALDLRAEGIECRVLNAATVKPLDEEAVVRAARETGAIVTVEEHYIMGGLSSLVSQVVAAREPVPVESVALRDYAESGAPAELLVKYRLTSADIAIAVRRVIGRSKTKASGP